MTPGLDPEEPAGAGMHAHELFSPVLARFQHTLETSQGWTPSQTAAPRGPGRAGSAPAPIGAAQPPGAAEADLRELQEPRGAATAAGEPSATAGRGLHRRTGGGAGGKAPADGWGEHAALAAGAQLCLGGTGFEGFSKDLQGIYKDFQVFSTILKEP